jgi:predicted ABC-type sugar transport system permease subunit
MRAGQIEIIYQDLAVYDNLTAAANMFLGRELRIGFGPFHGWLGAVITNLGQAGNSLSLRAAVGGGANLSGGAGIAFGAVIGAALIEVIRNSLLLLGVDAF